MARVSCAPRTSQACSPGRRASRPRPRAARAQPREPRRALGGAAMLPPGLRPAGVDDIAPRAVSKGASIGTSPKGDPLDAAESASNARCASWSAARIGASHRDCGRGSLESPLSAAARRRAAECRVLELAIRDPESPLPLRRASESFAAPSPRARGGRATRAYLTCRRRCRPHRMSIVGGLSSRAIEPGSVSPGSAPRPRARHACLLLAAAWRTSPESRCHLHPSRESPAWCPP